MASRRSFRISLATRSVFRGRVEERRWAWEASANDRREHGDSGRGLERVGGVHLSRLAVFLSF